MHQPSPEPADPAQAAPAPSLPGYRVDALLGSGASGTVWAVTRLGDGERLAAKVLHPGAGESSAELAVLRRIRHDHVVRLHDTALELSGPVPRLVLLTDLAEGGSLGDVVLGRGHLSVAELVAVLTPVARTLHDLHGEGLVHGDLSPGNVLLDAEGRPLLADFGVARLAALPGPQEWGTEGFVAPEVLAGRPPGPEADVYALGALAWTALVGSAPPAPALRPELAQVAPQAGPQLCALVLACLAHTPQDRPTAGEVTLALWDCGRPGRVPVAGAQVGGDPADPWTGLTQRIREQAQPVPATQATAWYRTRAAVAAVAVAAVAGTGLGLAVVRRDTPAPVVPAAARATPAAVPGSPSPRPAPARASGSSGATAVTHEPDLVVVQRLLDARSAAWADPRADLSRALVPGSPAWAAEQRDLQTVRAAGARYEGLRFTVRSATVSGPCAQRCRVLAVVDRSAYRVVTARQRQQRPATLGQHAVLELRRTGAGWRVAGWSLAPG